MAEVFADCEPIRLSELRSLEPPTWLIDGLIREGGLTIIFAAPDAGKTFVAIDLGVAIATGRPFAGRDCAGPRRAHLFLEEGGDMALMRVRAALQAKGLNEEELDNQIIPYKRVPRVSYLLSFMDEALKPLDGSVIVIDNLGKMTPGLDLNNNVDARLIVEALEKLTRTAGCTVILLHHEPKNLEGQRGSEFGSVFFRGGADATFRIFEEDGSRIFQASKERDAHGRFRRRFSIRPEILMTERAGEIESGVVEWDDGGLSKLDQAGLAAIVGIAGDETFTSGVFKRLKDDPELAASIEAKLGDGICGQLEGLESRAAKALFGRLEAAGCLEALPVAKGATARFKLCNGEVVEAAA